MSRIISSLIERSRSLTPVARYAAGTRLFVSTVGTVTGPIGGAIGSIVTRGADQVAESVATNRVADPSNVFECFWSRRITGTEAATAVSWHGIPLRQPGHPQSTPATKVWWSTFIQSQPKLDVATILHMWDQRIIEDAECVERLRAHGLDWHRNINHLMMHRGYYDFATATDLWHQGIITDADYKRAMFREGIPWDEAQQHLLSQRSVAPLGDYATWWLAGWIEDDAYKTRLRRAGISDGDDIDRSLRMRQPPPLDVCLADYHTGRFTEAETRERLARHGYGRPAEANALLDFQRPWTPSEALNLYFRRLADVSQLEKSLNANSIQGEARQQQWYKGTAPIPDAATLISFAVHEAWDPAVVQSFGYDAEFPPLFAFWMGVQGWGWGNDQDTLPGAPPGGVNWPQLFWRSHWRPMSPTQGYRALHRLRPDRINRYADRVPGLEPFLWADMEQVLKISDYPPKVRRWLAASSFAVLPIYVVRSLYRNGERDRAWLVDQFRDRGFSAEDAESAADDEDAKAREARLRAGRKARERATAKLIQTVIKAYRIGAISVPVAVARLREQGFSQADAESVINTTAAEANVELVETGIKRLRRAYFAGEWAPSQIAGQLQQMGIQPEAVARYVQQWNLERSQTRRMFSTSQIVKWVEEGRLQPGQAIERLQNLGWRDPDALLLLAEAREQLSEQQAKAEAAQDKARGKRQRELEAVEKQAEALRLKIQAQLRRETPLAALKKMICETIVSPQWAGDRMTAMGYQPEQIADYLKLWAQENSRNKLCGPVKEDTPETPGPAIPLPVTPAPSTTIPQSTGADKLIGGTKQIESQR